MNGNQPLQLDQEEMVKIMKDMYRKGQTYDAQVTAKDLIQEITGKLKPFVK